MKNAMQYPSLFLRKY